MLANLVSTGAQITLPAAAAPQGKPPVTPVTPVAETSSGGEAVKRGVARAGRRWPIPTPNVGNLARSARNFVALLELTNDPHVAAMFSGFGSGSHAGGHFDGYA